MSSCIINTDHVGITVTKVEYFDGDSWTDITTDEGAGYGDNYFWIDEVAGIIHFFGSSPLFVGYTVRLNYSYGASSVPATITRLCTLLVSVHILRAREYRVINPDIIDVQELIFRYQEEIDLLYRRNEKLIWM